MLKSKCEELYDRLREQIHASITRVRSNGNLNQYLYLDYAYYSGQIIPERISCKHFSVAATSPDKLRKFIESPTRKFMCINDVRLSPSKFEAMQAAILAAFEEKFPDKSRFEK